MTSKPSVSHSLMCNMVLMWAFVISLWMCFNGFMMALQISNITKTNKKITVFRSINKPSHVLQFVFSQALKAWALLADLHTWVFLPFLVRSWSRWYVQTPYYIQTPGRNLIFLYFQPRILWYTNQHFYLLFVKSGCKIKLPQFWIQYCNPKDVRTKLEHPVLWWIFFFS